MTEGCLWRCCCCCTVAGDTAATAAAEGGDAAVAARILKEALGDEAEAEAMPAASVALVVAVVPAERVRVGAATVKGPEGVGIGQRETQTTRQGEEATETEKYTRSIDFGATRV